MSNLIAAADLVAAERSEAVVLRRLVVDMREPMVVFRLICSEQHPAVGLAAELHHS